MRPPQWSERLLRLCCRGEAGRDIAGDLAEEFALVAAESGPRHARRWYRRQVLRSIAARLSAGLSVRRPERRRNIAGRLAADVRCAWRALAARRGSSLGIVAVLAVGLAAGMTMFALTDPYVLRPLPYANPHELAVIQIGTRGLTPDAIIPTLDEWRERTDLFQDLAATNRFGPALLLLTRTGALRFSTARVTHNFFDVLGITVPRSGAWRADDAGTEMGVVLTRDGLKLLGDATPDDGSSFPTAEGTRVLIAGRAPDTYLFVPGHALVPFEVGPLLDVTWTPDGSGMSTRGGLQLVARLRPGVSPEMVQEALAAPLPSGAQLDLRAEWLAERLTGSVRPLARGALLAAILILAVCAGNIVNLLIARGLFRAHDTDTRFALGASTLDVVRLWAAEAVVMMAAALGVALVTTQLLLAAIAGVIPPEYALFGAPALTARVVLFGGAASVLLLLLPSVLVSVAAGRAARARSSVAGSRLLKLARPAFGALQAALAMILAIGAAMLIQSYVRLIGQDIGHDPDALTVTVTYPTATTGSAVTANVEAALERLRRVPGVERAAARRGVHTLLPGARPPQQMLLTAVTPGYFDAAGMRLLEGRPQPDGSGVVVSESVATLTWPSATAVGQTFSYRVRMTPRTAAVVGVTRDVFTQLDDPALPAVFTGWDAEMPGATVTFVMRAGGDPLDRAAAVRQAIADVTPTALIGPVETVGGALLDSVRGRSFATLVLAFICLAAALVAVSGLAAMVAFVVARRTREIAIRMAMGADRGDVRRLVAREALVAAGLGGAAGLVLGRWLSTWLESLVFGITAGNWPTALTAFAVFLVLMVTASLIPARRAVRLEPVTALRVE